MDKTRTSTKILMVSLVLILAAGGFLVGYYYGKSSVVVQRGSYLNENETTQKASEEEMTEEETGEQITKAEKEKIREENLEQLFQNEIVDLNSGLEELGKKEYIDLTGDGIEEVVLLAMTTGSGGNTGVFVYGYQNGELQQLLADYQDGDFNYSYALKDNILYVEAVDSDSTLNEGKHKLKKCKDYQKFYQWQNGQFEEI